MNTETSFDTEHGACPECGLGYLRGYAPDEKYHRKVHDEAINGPRAKLEDGFLAVTCRSPIAIQKLAQAAASAARRETKYDFPSYEAMKKNADEYVTIAMLYIKSGRVVGLLVSRERNCKFTADLNSFRPDDFSVWRPTEVTEVPLRRRRAIDMIWVLKRCRKQGVAKGLADALSTHCKMKLGDLAHMTPFLEDAVRLWVALKLSTIYVV